MSGSLLPMKAHGLLLPGSPQPGGSSEDPHASRGAKGGNLGLPQSGAGPRLFEARRIFYSLDVLFCGTETKNKELKMLPGFAAYSGSFPAFQLSQVWMFATLRYRVMEASVFSPRSVICVGL